MSFTTDRLKVTAVREPWARETVSIRMFHHYESDTRSQISVLKIVPKPLSEEDAVREIEPTLRLRPEEAQSLMDELWNVGIRPAAAAGSAGQLSAVQAHLEDMRRLVFNPVHD